MTQPASIPNHSHYADSSAWTKLSQRSVAAVPAAASGRHLLSVSEPDSKDTGGQLSTERLEEGIGGGGGAANNPAPHTKHYKTAGEFACIF